MIFDINNTRVERNDLPIGPFASNDSGSVFVAGHERDLEQVVAICPGPDGWRHARAIAAALNKLEDERRLGRGIFSW